MGTDKQSASQHRQPSPRRGQFYVADESTLDASALQQFVNEEHAVAACSAFYL